MEVCEVFWINLYKNDDYIKYVVEWNEEIVEVEERLCWFVFYIVLVFLEMKEVGGFIEFLFVLINEMKKCLEYSVGWVFFGCLFLKCDDELLIFGFIKVCGGIYEVLKYVEDFV